MAFRRTVTPPKPKPDPVRRACLGTFYFLALVFVAFGLFALIDSRLDVMQTLELGRQRRLRAVVTRTFPLEGAEEAHGLLRQNALVGRAALVLR